MLFRAFSCLAKNSLLYTSYFFFHTIFVIFSDFSEEKVNVHSALIRRTLVKNES